MSLFKGMNARELHLLQDQDTLKQNIMVVLHALGRKNVRVLKGNLQK